jgi:hypothetical protein
MKKILLLGCICFILSTSLFSGCVNVPKELTQMTIYTFSAVPNIITQGQTANLSWSVFGATTVSIDHDIGTISLTGSRIITPTETTIYTLSASNSTGTISATTQVIVKSNITGNGNNESTPMSIPSFAVNPSIITAGETANLSWSVIGATTVSIDQSIGSVSLIGTRIITPTQSTTYTLTASNTIRTLTATVQILVNPYYSPPNQTPNVACTTDSTTNRIQVATADANIKWRDIVITTDNPSATWQVFEASGYALAQPGNTAAITTDINAGDYILISGTTGNVRVTLKYTPTNSLLGSWTINV